jgi:recombinational DNA repair protein (RecF pathway)
MNKSVNNEAIVIKRINYKDQDKIITLYTKEIGKIAVMAKGIRKIDSKRKSYFEPGNFIKIALIKSHKFHIAAQTELLNSYPQIKKTYEKANALYYILEIFDGLVPEEDDNVTIFKFLEKSLSTLENINEDKVTDFLNAYSIKLLRMSGFLDNPYEIIHTKTNKEFYSYLDNLINKTYVQIIEQPNEDFLAGEVFKLIKNYTENVLEKRIKSAFHRV